MRLIDADALVLKIESLGEKVPIPICTEIINGFQGMVKEAPTIEPRHLPDYSYEADMVKRLRNNTDLISRADAIEAVRKLAESEASKMRMLNKGDIMVTDIDFSYLEVIDNILALPSAEQVISKLNNPCDSLLTDESNGSKEHKSKLDLISRQDVIDALSRSSVYAWSIEQDQTAHDWALNIIKALPSADAIHSGGVFVPNMEMPKACDYCLFHDSGWSWCKAKDKYCGDGKCPLIAVRGERREL